MADRLGDPKYSPGPAAEGIAVDVSSTDQSFSPTTRYIVAQTAGIVKCDLEQAGSGLLIHCAAGVPMPIRVKKIYKTGTAASGVVALW